MERIQVSNGLLYVHDASECVTIYCCIHNPSDHRLSDAPLLWRSDRRIMERTCDHGIGHPDPDQIFKGDTDTIHGCDGCCR